MADTCKAWLLDFGHDFMAATARYELEDVYTEARLTRIPMTPPYCQQVMHWRQRLIPIFNMASFLSGESKEAKQPIIGIFGYQAQKGDRVQYGGLILKYRPEAIEVRDADACELPTNNAQWQYCALSSFRQSAQVVPILDLSYLFTLSSQAPMSRRIGDPV